MGHVRVTNRENKERIMRRPIVLFVLPAVGFVGLAVIGMLANARAGTNPNQNRQITLSPQAGAPFDIASGSFIVSPLEPFGRFFTYQMQQLRSQSESNAYAIYLSVGNRGRFRLRTFDTSGGERNTKHWRGFDGIQPDAPRGSLPAANDPAWVTDKIVVEIYVEADDGFHAPDVGGLLVLRGEDAGSP